ncbi:PEBP-like protein [Ceratobasidium sp. AG-I]|nr:PEBP-like protein [Ceratobasidium sp. AG-I]
MFVKTAFIALAVAPFAFAQNNAVGLQSIIAQFKNAGLTPDPLTTFTPSALLGVTYGSSAIDAGKPQTVANVKPQPTVTLTPVNDSPDVTASSTYTIAMIDADIVGADQAEGQTRHWLVNGVKATGTSAPWTLDLNSGTNITAYGGPFPAEGSGAHRYMILLLAQPSAFAAPAAPAAGSPIEKFDFESYVKDAGLGSIVAATYMTVEQGTATQSVSVTSAVNTATLSGASSAAASGSATGSRSGTASASAASSSSSANAASGRVVEWGMLGAAALLGAVAF